jgi:hypothetical protein
LIPNVLLSQERGGKKPYVDHYRGYIKKSIVKLNKIKNKKKNSNPFMIWSFFMNLYIRLQQWNLCDLITHPMQEFLQTYNIKTKFWSLKQIKRGHINKPISKLTNLTGYKSQWWYHWWMSLGVEAPHLSY